MIFVSYLDLIEKEDNKFKIYRVIADKHKVSDFKMKEMGKIQFDLRVLKATTNDKDILKIDNDVEEFSFDDLNYKRGFFGSKYHSISTHNALHSGDDVYHYERTIHYVNNILKGYYDGLYDDKCLAVVKGVEGCNYYLVGDDYIYKKEHSKIRSISTIINLPESLYLLHLLLNKRVDLVKGKPIDEQMALFDFTGDPIKIFESEEIKDYDRLCMELYGKKRESTYDLLIRKAEDCANVLQYVKK